MSRIALPALILTAFAAPVLAQTPERFTLTGPRVAIWNIAGKVSLQPASGRAVTVAVTRRGSDASELEIARGEIGGRETLRVIYPGDAIVYDMGENRGNRWRTELRVRDDGTFGGDNWDRGRRSSGREVRVSGSGSGTEASADLEINVPVGQEIVVYLAVGEITARNLDGKIVLDTHGAPVTASGMKGELIIDTGSGDVDVNGMTGNLLVDVGSGDVTLASIRGGTLDIDTGSGEVQGTAVASDALNVDTGSGGVELEGLSAQRVSIDVGSGDIELGFTTDPGDISIDSGSGSVRLLLPAASGATLEIETSSGDIESAFQITTTRIARDAVRGSFGDGRGRIAIETGSGDVNLIRR